jgi:hypothetical protein
MNYDFGLDNYENFRKVANEWLTHKLAHDTWTTYFG